MKEAYFGRIAAELNLQPRQVQATATLLADGATVPFIARYRKEATGAIDEVAIAAIRDRLMQLAELDTRREAIIKSLDERKLLTPELVAAVQGAETMAALEDVYQPYRPKRRTRAIIAKERGLEPLADFIFQNQEADPAGEAAKFVDTAKEVPSAEDALAGARDIIAERVSDDADARGEIRELFLKSGVLKSEVIPTKEVEGAKFRDYFEWSEPLAKAPSHRVLAIRRGEKEGFLSFRILPPEEDALTLLDRRFVKGKGPAAQQVREAVKDSFKRLLGPSMETEARVRSKQRADEEAVRVFAENLRELLMASPLGQKRTLAIDPGFRTGCKVACMDAQGKLLHHDVIYPEMGTRQNEEAALKLREFCRVFQIEAIAIGNGTASRETEAFVRTVGLPPSIAVVVVNESGASVYSASEAAREEFPDHDITVRGAVSIGRRLMDPLAELVKIDPKSIGVGQYQHDVDEGLLKRGLDDVVISCVNRVGVEVNTASRQLLSYVSGLNGQIAGNIIEYRNANGPFRSRKELLKVSRLGPKTFEQAAGFLRIRDGEHPLDGSAVHPESYEIVERMARDQGCTIPELMKDAGKRAKIKLEAYVTDKFGLPTLQDIMNELAKPGRDPREKFEVFQFADGVTKMEDLKPGMRLPGIVTNVTAFGAFVDVGVHQDGLVHVSQLADKFVQNPADVVKVAQRVTVTVLEVDIPRKRISLSMRTNPEKPAARQGGDAGRGPGGFGGGRPGPGGNGPRSPQPDNRGPRQPQTLQPDWFSAAVKKKK